MRTSRAFRCRTPYFAASVCFVACFHRAREPSRRDITAIERSIAMTSIAVRDLETGERAARPADTLTIDVPLNFVPGREFTVADGFRAQYTAAGGGNVVCKVAPRP